MQIPDTESAWPSACVGGLHEATLPTKASPRAVHVDGPCDVHTKPPMPGHKRKGLTTTQPYLPAAWTTRPRVVVILELLGLAVSGSEVQINKSATKQCETENVRTNDLEVEFFESSSSFDCIFPMTVFSLWLQTLGSFPCPERGGAGRDTSLVPAFPEQTIWDPQLPQLPHTS